ncbi:phage tail tape measure protein [Chromobacterium subtsugae]|uniref:phage tail tape measure protein n=1 Tax=Chromobacterium subtsugae TaxID=251747 RepID=UPI000640EB86|nr:phage tail tape measure protein [Chromobacterium subtsugae]
MSRDVAIGIVIGGAVSATLGHAVGKAKQSIDGLQKGLGDTKSIKALIGETQRLQRELAAADKVTRRAGLEGVRQMRGEVRQLDGDWKRATDRVGDLTRQLSKAKAEAAKAGGALPDMEQALRRQQSSVKAAEDEAARKRAHWQDGKAGGLPRQQVLQLKAEAAAAGEAARAARAKAAEQRGEIATLKASMSAEAGLASELKKAAAEAGRAKRAFQDKREAVQQARASLQGAAGAAEVTAGKLGQAAKQADGLGGAVRKAAQAQQQLAGSPLRTALDANIAQLKAMGIHVGDLDRAMRKLQQTEKGMQWKDAGAARMKEGLQMGATVGTSVIGTTAIPTKISGDFQAEIRDIAIKAGIAGKGEEAELSATIRRTAADEKMDRTALAQAINGLVTQGMDAKEATGHGQLLAQLIKGQQMDPGDAAKLIFSFGQNGVSPEQMIKAMGSVAIAGDMGAFEAKDMAKHMPGLLAASGAMGFNGPKAVEYIAASLQAQQKLTGNADEGANNFKNLLAKIVAPDTTKAFKDAGVDLQASMQEYIKAGYNPIEAFISLTERLQADKDPAKGKNLQGLKQKIKSSKKGSAEESQALEAYLKMAGLSELLGDQQARMGALAQIKYGGQIKEDLDTMHKKDGAAKLKQDKQDRDATSNAKWAAASADFNAAMISVGDAIRPVTDRAAELASAVLQIGASFSSAHPEAAMLGLAAGAATMAYAGAKVVSGAGQWIGGKALGLLAGRLPGGAVTKAASAGAKSGPGGKLASLLAGEVGVQRVFVTNWPGGGLPGLDVDGPGKSSGKGRAAAKGGRLARIGQAVRAGGGRLGDLARGVRGAGWAGAARGAVGVAGRLGGAALAVGTAGVMAYDTYRHAKTGEEKGAGYGGAAGGLAGGLAGAKLGALVGTMVMPGVGTVVGGLIGGAVGSLAGVALGKSAGGAVGRAISPGASQSALPGRPAAEAAAVAPALAGVGKPGSPAAPPVQHFTFSPQINVKVLGDVKNPAQIAQELQPHLKRLFDQWAMQSRPAGGGQLYDPVG